MKGDDVEFWEALGREINRLRLQREDANLEHLAADAGIGSASHLSHVEQGRKRLGLKKLAGLARALDTTIHGLLVGAGQAEPLESMLHQRDLQERASEGLELKKKWYASATVDEIAQAVGLDQRDSGSAELARFIPLIVWR